MGVFKERKFAIWVMRCFEPYSFMLDFYLLLEILFCAMVKCWLVAGFFVICEAVHPWLSHSS